MRWDGLVERLVYYGDDKYKDLVECHDFYQRRKDMLKKRIYYIKEMKVIYYLFFHEPQSSTILPYLLHICH
jgi:hypothetical protein